MTDQIQVWVDKLGGMTPDEIANFLQEEGIIGYKTAVSTCPISILLQAKLPAVVPVTSPSYIIDVSGNEMMVKVPDSLGEFIRNFDQGHYPELDADA